MVLVYEVVTTMSVWWYVGLGLLVVGTIVVTGGVAAYVWMAKGVAVAAGLAVSVGGAMAGIGAGLVNGVPGGYDRGQLRDQYGGDAPMGPWKQASMFERMVNDWHPC